MDTLNRKSQVQVDSNFIPIVITHDDGQNWFNGIFNAGKKQSLSWEVVVV